MKSLGEKISHEMGQFFIQNSFFIVLLVTMVLFVLDFYGRFYKINKETDNINLVDRWCWLTYYRNRR